MGGFLVDKNAYRKLFFIFNQEDAGFGAGQSPSGYVKIEARDGKGKLSAIVHNLKEDSKSIMYRLYIMECNEKSFSPVAVGVIPVLKGKGELHWEFQPGNIAKSNSTLEDINTVAVIAEYIGRDNKGIACPLAAYKDKKTLWRQKLKDKLNTDIYASTSENTNIDKDINEPISENINSREEVKKSEDINGQEQVEKDENINDSREAENIEHNQAPELPNIPGDIQNIGYKDMEEVERHYYTMKNSGISLPCGSTSCGYLTGVNGDNSCDDCMLKKQQQDNSKSNAQGDVDKLRKDLDKYFEISDPFRSRRKDYKWWKVNSPVYLNNVLYQCQIKTPVLFNPKILMSHFKYRHLIFGIYSDTLRHKEYVVFGVPGVYSVDDRPFKDICRWAQVEGNKPRYGAFGYWLVYIDPKTGRIV